MKHLFSLPTILLIIFGISGYLFVVRPLLHPGFFPTMDDVQVVRIDLMTRELLSGQFPVRWVRDLGNGGGYFLFNFYPPFVYYIGAAIHLIGIPLVKSTKLMFLMGYAVAGSGMFLFLKRHTNKFLALMGAILFLFAPFLNYEVYTRGDLAEFFAFCLIPLFFYAFDGLLLSEQKIYLFLTSLLYAGIVIAHSFVGLTLNIFILLFLGFTFSKYNLIKISQAVLLGLALSSFYWMPALFEIKLTAYSTSYFANTAYRTNFLNPLAAFGITPPSWGFLPPIAGAGIGIGSLAALLYVLLRRKKSVYPYLAGLLVSLFLVSSISKPLWDNITLLRDVQFPWRFLGFSSFFAVSAIVLSVTYIKNTTYQVLLIALLIVSIPLLHMRYLMPTTYNYVSTYYAEDTCSTTTWAEEYMPRGVTCLPKRKDRSIIAPLVESSKGITVTVREILNGRKLILSKAGGPGIITVRRYSFPGWEVESGDGRQVPISTSRKYGLMQINSPRGVYHYIVELQDTPIRSLSNVISALSLLLFVLLLGFLVFSLNSSIIKERLSEGF